MRTLCHIKSRMESSHSTEKPVYYELEREAQVGDFVYFELADQWVLVTAKYIFMAAQIEQNVIVLDALTTAPPTDIRPPAL